MFYGGKLKNCRYALPCFHQDGDNFCGVLFVENPGKTHYFSFYDRQVHLVDDILNQKNFVRCYSGFKTNPLSPKLDLGIQLRYCADKIKRGERPGSFGCLFHFENDLFFYYFDNRNSMCYEFILFDEDVNSVHERRELTSDMLHWDYYIQCRSDISAKFFNNL